MPHVLLAPDRRRAVGPIGNRLAGCQANVELALRLPVDAVVGREPMGAVVAALGEHVILALVLDDHHVLDPLVLEKRVVRMAGPVDAVLGGRIAQHARAILAAVVAGVPELVEAVPAQDPAALAALRVPWSRAGLETRTRLGRT